MDDNERLLAVEPRLRLRRFRLERGSNSGPLDQMDDLRFYALFNSFSVISGRCAGDNERLLAMEPRLRLEDFASSGARTNDR